MKKYDVWRTLIIIIIFAVLLMFVAWELMSSITYVLLNVILIVILGIVEFKKKREKKRYG